MLSFILIIFLLLLAIGAPIAISLVFTTLAACVTNPMLPIDGVYIYKNLVTALNSYAILAVPLFVFSGIIMARGGISKRLFNFFAYFIGKITAGLPAASVVTCLFYGAISGSGPATTAAVGSMAVPYLEENGYAKDWSVALIAVAGGLGVIIPPSVPFIMYGQATTEVSVGGMFKAGILPGLLIGLFLILYCWFYCKKHGEDKELLKKGYDEMHSKGFFTVFKDSFWALLTPVLILGGIYGGIVTPTEAAAVSVVYSLIVSMFIYRSVKLKDLPGIIKEAIDGGIAMSLVIAAATVFSRCLTLLQIPQELATVLSAVFTNKYTFLIGMNILFLFVGMILDTTSAILILTPLLLPMAMSFGVSAYHFGIIMVVDDIQVGCGRAGYFFSFEPAGIVPDMITMSKSISGFGNPMGIVLVKPEYDIFSPGEHNGTYRGVQLSLIGARAALEVFVNDDIPAQVAHKHDLVVDFVEKEILPLSDTFSLRGRGLIMGVDTQDPALSKRIADECFRRHLIMERSGRDDEVLKIMPPLVISDEILMEGLEIFRDSVKAILSE